MSQLLDLSITLTPPPDGALPEAIASIALRSDPQGLTHSGDLLTDPLTKQERDDLLWYLEEYPDWPYEQFLERARKIEALLPELGKRLYNSVFGSLKADRILQAWRLQPGEQRQISIISDMPVALSLPWELLHDEQGFLVLRTRNPIPIVRRLLQSELAAFPTPFEPPLRVLLVTARPEGAGFVDPRSIARELLEEVEEQVQAGAIQLEFLRPPTLHALRKRLGDSKRPPIHILHFDGHGTFSEEMDEQDGLHLHGGKQGMLAFENDEGKLDLVKAEDVAQVLQDSRVKLAMLTACQSAMSSADNALSSVAARLIKSGVDAVAAMSASVLVVSAARYAEAFYHELAMGTSATVAQERARQALYDDPRRHVHRRRRDEEGKPVELRDWWLPHFYQQRMLEMRPTRPSGELKQQGAPSVVRLSESTPPEPRYGFSGRAYELLQIERWLMRRKLVVIHGFGGNGKTALVREAADWLTRTKMYERACFVSFEHGGDATVLLSALGNFMGVYDGNYNPNDPKAALARLKTALKEHPTMLIADNLESILPGGEVPLEAGLRTQLWEVLLELTKMGAGVLLTTRDTNFGDGRMAPGKWLAYLPLGGLHPEDAYALTSRLLDDLGIDRTRAPYTELRDLLAQLDYHPLAIQLVFPALHELPLSKIRDDFTKLLPKFADNTIEGRNRSLSASLEYSLRRLSEKQRALLPRLVVFEGGAYQEALLRITEIPRSEWIELRFALEQVSLVMVEQIHEYLADHFLRFHPVLIPFLRTHLCREDTALRERYVMHYCSLVRYMYDKDAHAPQLIRPLMQRELPNLRRVLGILLEDGKQEMAYGIANIVARFLYQLGLERERDELRRRVAESMTITNTLTDERLNQAEWLRESGLGEDEFNRGNIGGAHTRFANLLARIEALPEGMPLGQNSYEHCQTLRWLACCLNENKQPTMAENRLRKALTIIGVLMKQQPDNQSLLIYQRAVLLGDLGVALRAQGRYSEARLACEEALQIDIKLGNLRSQGIGLSQLGELALEQQEFAEAQSYYATALEISRLLDEPVSEAIVWHQLGRVAEGQKEWTEAERCYSKSLAINELLGNVAGAIINCNQLAIIALVTGRSIEAEGWWKHALELNEQAHISSASLANILNNLAGLLVSEIQANRIPMTRLVEARNYAERTLAMQETLDVSSGIWKTVGILAIVADLECRQEVAREYRRRERETFAAFAGNRYHIDRQFGQIIEAIAAAAKGDEQARKVAEEALPELEEKGWRIADATKHIWAGERNWYSLAVDLDVNSALLVLRVLETIEQLAEAQGKAVGEEK